MRTDCSVIKSRINCVDYAKRAGLPINKSGDRCVSPLRPNAKNKTSFVCHDDFFYDFAAEHGGDVIDLCALLTHGGNKGEAIRELAALTGVEEEPSASWVSATNGLNNLVQKWHESIPEETLNYILSRGITKETISALKIGHTGDGERDGYCSKRISVPYWKNGYTYSYVARATLPGQDPKYLKRRNDDISDPGAPWGMQTLSATDKPLIIAEGAFDALSFYQEGFPVLATMGGAFSKDQTKTVLSVAHNYSFVCLSFDMDEPGVGFAHRLAKTLFLHRIPFKICKIPRPHKDISDYYAAGGSLQSLVSRSSDGPLELALSTANEKDFKQLMHAAALYIDAPELSKIFSEVRSSRMFDDAWLSALQKACDRPPSEDSIASSVTSRHNLRYLENVGFYEYLRGVWRRIDDTQVMGYIGDELGRHRTGSKLSSIVKIIKADTLTDQPFDRAPVFNFINGTLDLSDPPSFREHRMDDLCSIQAQYPYDASARSPSWEQFIRDVCNDDDKRAQLLQEIAGYVLFPDCSLEKIFVLQGDGGNGKSVFLNILQAVFGEENTSTVTVSGLCEDFQRVLLSTSLINIASEIKSNLSGAEEYLKQIASGDSVSACYKHKNHIKFRPRCKLIFATNGHLKAQDTSEGLVRRLSIVNFTQSFVDDPQLPNQRRRDTTLYKRLLQELPAVFNWCLEGYSLLSATREFTVMEDEEDAKRDFRAASNPIITFLEEENVVQPGGFIPRTELRDKWKAWAEENGHVVGSSTRLYREVRKLFPYGTMEVDTTVNGESFRGFMFPGRIDCDAL